MSYKVTEDCTGCTLCAKNCPVEAISGNIKELHTINESRCIDCGVCGTVCAKAAIIDNNGNICERVAKNEWMIPYIDQKKCTACRMVVDLWLYLYLYIGVP